jgi:hypothetical protein
MKPHIAYNLRGRQSIAQKNMSVTKETIAYALELQEWLTNDRILLSSPGYSTAKIWWCAPMVAPPKSQRDGRGSMARKVCC